MTIARALVALPVRSTALVGLLPPGRGVASDVCACALLAIAECLLRCLAPRWRGKLAGDRDLPCPDGCNWTTCALAPAESPPLPPPAVVRLPAERPIAEKSSRCTLGDGFWMPAS